MTEAKLISIHGDISKEQVEKIRKFFPEGSVVTEDNRATSIRAVNIRSDSVLVLKGKFEVEIFHQIAAVLHARGVYPMIVNLADNSDIETMDEEAMKRHGWQRIRQ